MYKIVDKPDVMAKDSQDFPSRHDIMGVVKNKTNLIRAWMWYTVKLHRKFAIPQKYTETCKQPQIYTEACVSPQNYTDINITYTFVTLNM